MLFSLSVMSNSLRPYGLQHARLPCSSLSRWVWSNSSVWWCMSWWCHTTSVVRGQHPLLPPSLPTLNLSQHQGLFQWVGSSSNQVANYWSFSFSISPSNEYLGLISFRSDWFDLLQSKGLLRVHVVPCGKYMIEPQWKFLTTEAWVSFPGWQYYIMLPNISTRKVTLIHGKDNGIWPNNPTFECISKGIELRFSPRYLNTHFVC